MAPHDRFARVDDLLAAHADALGGDFSGYRNHVHRVAELCADLAPDPPGAREIRMIGIAAAFHDLGIWTDRTFDYLEPSVRRAETHLAAEGLAAWAPEIAAMIRAHHKLTAWRGPAPLVEPFRRADWIDVTRGVVGGRRLPPGRLAALYAAWPGAGFHRRLLELGLGRAARHPLSPLPMLRF